MGPPTVAQVGAAGVLQCGPQVGRVAQTPWAQLEPDESGEGLLGRTTDPTAPDRLGERSRLGQVGGGGQVAHVVDPTLGEREQRLESGQGRLLGGSRVRAEEVALQAPRRASGSEASIVVSADSMASVSIVMLRA